MNKLNAKNQTTRGKFSSWVNPANVVEVVNELLTLKLATRSNRQPANELLDKLNIAMYRFRSSTEDNFAHKIDSLEKDTMDLIDYANEVIPLLTYTKRKNLEMFAVNVLQEKVKTG